jgi:hypothetical protein
MGKRGRHSRAVRKRASNGKSRDRDAYSKHEDLDPHREDERYRSAGVALPTSPEAPPVIQSIGSTIICHALVSHGMPSAGRPDMDGILFVFTISRIAEILGER